MQRCDIIQKLIDVNSYKSYLELGTFMGDTFESLSKGLPYNGTVFRSIGRLHATNPFVKICTVDTDWGVGIIVPTGEPQHWLQVPFESYHDFTRNKQHILNLISVNTFEEMFRYKIEQPLPKIDQPKRKKFLGLI